MSKKIITKVTVKLLSQPEPIVMESEYYFVNSDRLNDTRIDFIDIDGNSFRKSDILHITTEKYDVEEEEDEETKE